MKFGNPVPFALYYAFSISLAITAITGEEYENDVLLLWCIGRKYCWRGVRQKLIPKPMVHPVTFSPKRYLPIRRARETQVSQAPVSSSRPAPRELR